MELVTTRRGCAASRRLARDPLPCRLPPPRVKVTAAVPFGQNPPANRDTALRRTFVTRFARGSNSFDIDVEFMHTPSVPSLPVGRRREPWLLAPGPLDRTRAHGDATTTLPPLSRSANPAGGGARGAGLIRCPAPALSPTRSSSKRAAVTPRPARLHGAR